MLCKSCQYCIVHFFCSFDLALLFPFFIWSKLYLSFFASDIFISSFFILSIRFKALSCLSNFSSGVLPLYLCIKPSRLTFLSNSVISSSLLSTSLLNIYFCFEINGLSSSSSAYFLIVLTFPWVSLGFIYFSP